MLNQATANNPRMEKLEKAFAEVQQEFLAEIHGKYNELEAKNSTIRQGIETNSKELKRLEAELPEVKEENAGLIAQNEGLKIANERVLGEVSEVKKNLVQATTELQELNSMIVQQKNALHNLKEQIVSHETKKSGLETENKQLTKKNLELELLHNENRDNFAKQSEELKHELGKLEHEKLGLSTILKEKREELASEEMRLGQINTSIKELEKTMENFVASVAQGKTELEKQQAEKLKLEEELRVSQQKHEKSITEAREKLAQDELFIEKAKALIEEKQGNVQVVCTELSNQISNILVIEEFNESAKSKLKNLLSAIAKI